MNIGVLEYRAKFAREAELDLSPTAPASEREAVERRHREARQALAYALMEAQARREAM